MYYALWMVLPGHNVFGSLYRMFLYHWNFPMQYIAIPCFFYGIIAVLFADKFQRNKTIGRIIITMAIVVLTMIISSPVGGVLWHYHDMKAGFFPDHWISKLIHKGLPHGLFVGWLVIKLSLPYNILGSILCFFLTKKGIELFNIAKHKAPNTD